MVTFALLLLAPIMAYSRPMWHLWPAGPPDHWKRTDAEIAERQENADFHIVRNVSDPTLELYRSSLGGPGAPTVVICPGGGYYIEAIEHEGAEVAAKLNQAGIHAAVLKYRLPNRDADHPLHKAPVQDAERAIRLLRFHSEQLKIDPHRIGLMGFSAGGHLAAVESSLTEATYAPSDPIDAEPIRPDFTILVYPAYLDTKGVALLTPDVSVSSATPPAFIVQTMDDPLKIEGAVAYTLACHQSQVPVELHLFPKGGHGYGVRSKEPGISKWPELLADWIHRLYR